MKKAILSPLCSALIIPGLGQILNGQAKKGIAMLGAVLVLIMASFLKLYAVLLAVTAESESTAVDPEPLVTGFTGERLPLLWILLALFSLLWIYSVLDAYLAGRKLDQRQEGNRP